MVVSRRASRSRFTLALLVLTSVTILTLDQRGDGARALDGLQSAARDALAPLQRAASGAFDPVGDLVGGITGYDELEEENARLRAQLEETRGDRIRAADAQRELEALTELQGIDFVGDIPTVAARVVSTAPSSFELAVVIDRGTDDGVLEGMPVVTGGGLVGRITETSSTRATVLLISDPTFAVGIRLATSGEVGAASGRGRERPLQVDLVDASVVVEPGEAVVTSGLQQSRFPPGIPVGTVDKAEARPGELRQRVTVAPAVDLQRLTFVRVVQWGQG